MAYRINDYCNACGECIQICPNGAISLGVRIFRIEPLLCTECVGYADAPQCADACPMEALELLLVTPGVRSPTRAYPR